MSAAEMEAPTSWEQTMATLIGQAVSNAMLDVELTPLVQAKVQKTARDAVLTVVHCMGNPALPAAELYLGFLEAEVRGHREAPEFLPEYMELLSQDDTSTMGTLSQLNAALSEDADADA